MYRRGAGKSIAKYRLGSKLLSEITATDIQRLLVTVRDSGRSAATANHVGKTLMVMLKHAVRDGLLDHVPDVQYLSETPAPRGVFRLEEVQRLLAPDTWKSVWSNNLLHYTLNATAACTGMRLEELHALLVDCVHDDHLEIRRAWDRKTGLKEQTKTRVEGVAPNPEYVRELIEEILPESGHVFSSNGGRSPVYHQTVSEHLRAGFDAAKVKDHRERRLSMHSWHHWFNTWCRLQGVPDPMLRKVTRIARRL